MNTNLADLKSKYSELATVTYDHCKKTCTNMGSCCDPMYCVVTIDFASSSHGVTLVPTEHKKFPLMNPDGSCSAEPYLRPLCAAHQCDVSAIGVFRNDLESTKRYFEIRSHIDDLELVRFNSTY